MSPTSRNQNYYHKKCCPTSKHGTRFPTKTYLKHELPEQVQAVDQQEYDREHAVTVERADLLHTLRHVRSRVMEELGETGASAIIMPFKVLNEI